MSTSLQTTGLLVVPQAHWSHCCSGLRTCCSLCLQCSSLKSSHGRLVPMLLLSAQVLPTPANSYLNMLSEHIHRHTHQLLTGLLSLQNTDHKMTAVYYQFTVCFFLLKTELRGMVTLFFSVVCLFLFIAELQMLKLCFMHSRLSIYHKQIGPDVQEKIKLKISDENSQSIKVNSKHLQRAQLEISSNKHAGHSY